MRLVKPILAALRLLLGATFLYAGFVKVPAGAQLAMTLAPFTIVPISWHAPLGFALPYCEILAGLMIMIPRTKRIGAAMILGLSLIFITVLGWALANGIIVSCSCFGNDETPSAFKMALAMARDVLIALAAIAVLGERLVLRLTQPRTVDTPPKNSSEWVSFLNP